GAVVVDWAPGESSAIKVVMGITYVKCKINVRLVTIAVGMRVPANTCWSAVVGRGGARQRCVEVARFRRWRAGGVVIVGWMLSGTGACWTTALRIEKTLRPGDFHRTQCGWPASGGR